MNSDFDTEESGKRRLCMEANKIKDGHFGSHLCEDTLQRRFMSLFGVTFQICFLMWCLLDVENEGPHGACVCHLLWTLMFLKTYDTNDNLVGTCKVDPKTFRKWKWLMLFALTDLHHRTVSNPCYSCAQSMINSSNLLHVFRLNLKTD